MPVTISHPDDHITKVDFGNKGTMRFYDIDPTASVSDQGFSVDFRDCVNIHQAFLEAVKTGQEAIDAMTATQRINNITNTQRSGEGVEAFRMEKNEPRSEAVRAMLGELADLPIYAVSVSTKNQTVSLDFRKTELTPEQKHKILDFIGKKEGIIAEIVTAKRSTEFATSGIDVPRRP